MGNASLGQAAVVRGLTPMWENLAMNPRDPDQITVYGGSRYAGSGLGGGRAPDAAASGASGRRGLAAPEGDEAANPTSQAQQRIAELTDQLKEQNLQTDLEIAKTISGDAVEANAAQVQNLLGDAQKKQIGNLYQAAKLTADQDGYSTIAGEMWDELRWAGGKTEGTLAQFYIAKDGSKRLRMVRPKKGLLPRGQDGVYTNVGAEGQQQQPGYEPVIHQGRPVDFAVDALEKAYPLSEEDAKNDKQFESIEAPKWLVKAGIAKDLTQAYEMHRSGKLDVREAASKMALAMHKEQADQYIEPGDKDDEGNVLYRSMEQLYEQAVKMLAAEPGAGDKSGGGGKSLAFRTPEEVRAAFKGGKITREEAKRVLKEMQKQQQGGGD